MNNIAHFRLTLGWLRESVRNVAQPSALVGHDRYSRRGLSYAKGREGRKKF
jgi:hypothetical protein